MEAKRQIHIQLAHSHWAQLEAQHISWAVDATCGNGHDTLKLSEMFTGVIGLDIQEKALVSTRGLLGPKENVHLFLQSHETFPSLAYEVPIRLVVYNLGYLPGGNKALTTRVDSTLKSLKEARELVCPSGMISITCYPGHPEGLLEQEALLEACKDLPSDDWSVSHQVWINRIKAPSLLILRKLQ